MTSWNLADLVEQTAAVVPDRLAISSPLGDLTYEALASQARDAGRALIDAGVEPGERVALLAWNRPEWLVAMIGCFEASVVPVNVNYRYVDEEVAHLLSDSDSVAVITEPEFLPLLRRILPDLPLCTRTIVFDGPGRGEPFDRAATLDAMAWTDWLTQGRSSSAELARRSGDDRYILYTGGTTGMPKGVLWRQEDIFLGAMTSLETPADPSVVTDTLAPARAPWLVTSPLMHGNGQWNSLRPLIAGNGVSLWVERRFDPLAVIEQAERDRAQLIVLVGDGMARPFAEALADVDPAPDLSSVAVLASGGAILSPVVKEQLAALLPDVLIVDGFGASESGGNGALVGTGDGGAPRFQMKPDTAVLDDDGRPLPPGSGITGRLARTGHIPLGYHKDPVKTAATFPTGPDGRRWAIPGDAARLEADGTITVFGRGSNCINTGGEKVFPEEVEAKLKAHPAVMDAFVLGRADERFGQRVAAVVAARPGTTPTLDDLDEFLRSRVAHYKIPRELVVVDALTYTGPGKPDYRWAKEQFNDPD